MYFSGKNRESGFTFWSCIFQGKLKKMVLHLHVLRKICEYDEKTKFG